MALAAVVSVRNEVAVFIEESFLKALPLFVRRGVSFGDTY